MRIDHDPIHSGSCLDTIRRFVCACFGRAMVMCAILALIMTTACQNRDVEAQAEAANAMALLEQKRLAEARLAIARALILRDDVVDYHIARGRIEFAAGALSAAFDAYSDALSLDASNMEALQAVSQLGLQTGNIRASLSATDTLVLLNPGDTSALVTRGVHALISSRLDEADDFAARALAVNPASDDAVILRSRILYLKGKNQDALDLLEQHARGREPSVGIYLMRLELFRAKRNPQGMEAQFNALRAIGHETWQLKVDEANFLSKIGRRDAGLDQTVDLLSSPELSRDGLRSVMGLWTIWTISDIDAQSVTAISKSGTQAARYNVAVFLARQSAFSPASEIAKSLKGNDRDAVRALIALRSGRGPEAARLSREILRADMTHCLALEVQARINLANGKVREALSSAQQVSAQCPDEAAGWVTAARAYSELGDPENARRVLRQGAEANPQDWGFVIEHTEWLRSQGKDREALAAARRLTRNAPALVKGWELYRDLCSAAADPCVGDAESGLADSRTRYWIDYEPGESPPPSLFGRLKEI
jgi:tetratricopeptide (TPR) repeat protein